MHQKHLNILSEQLGESFHQLSPLVRQVHIGKQCIKGNVKVERGNLVARLICNLFGFPKANDNVVLSVDCCHSGDGIEWFRNFDGHIMRSHFIAKEDFLVEKLGPLDLHFRAEEEEGTLKYRFFKTKFWRIPLPGFLSPNIYAVEFESNEVYQFKVKVSMPFVGLILAYGGSMQLVNDGVEA
ncbi:DUF4166 domain-containing protein [Pleionea sp. CnH1-48]|uniref:DUF4166 domain-containing protein n=1 Tax=Pleionea sp. CnH1-48 TaxID=2954494 RepID=UPI0020976F52|nr:DUF4166 domain-containing protein [Pleionea sp. CnH1-48]MCO7224125.1 DUF4166 domain-containing protein [Pleionea sp. CnH1-48]